MTGPRIYHYSYVGDPAAFHCLPPYLDVTFSGVGGDLVTCFPRTGGGQSMRVLALDINKTFRLERTNSVGGGGYLYTDTNAVNKVDHYTASTVCAGAKTTRNGLTIFISFVPSSSPGTILRVVPNGIVGDTSANPRFFECQLGSYIPIRDLFCQTWTNQNVYGGWSSITPGGLTEGGTATIEPACVP